MASIAVALNATQAIINLSNERENWNTIATNAVRPQTDLSHVWEDFQLRLGTVVREREQSISLSRVKELHRIFGQRNIPPREVRLSPNREFVPTVLFNSTGTSLQL